MTQVAKLMTCNVFFKIFQKYIIVAGEEKTALEIRNFVISYWKLRRSYREIGNILTKSYTTVFLDSFLGQKYY
jgi:hypothetical protein